MNNFLSYHHELAGRLSDASYALQAAAERVPQRQRPARRAMDAAQAKLTAELVGRGWVSTDVAEAVLTASESLVLAYETHDMEDVHRERAERRDAHECAFAGHGGEGCYETKPHRHSFDMGVVYL